MGGPKNIKLERFYCIALLLALGLNLYTCTTLNLITKKTKCSKKNCISTNPYDTTSIWIPWHVSCKTNSLCKSIIVIWLHPIFTYCWLIYKQRSNICWCNKMIEFYSIPYNKRWTIFIYCYYQTSIVGP